MSDLTPLPGNPADIKAEAKMLAKAAADMRSAAKRIDKLTNFGGYSSAAVAAATKKADGIHGGLEVAEKRYQDAATALDTWARDLETVQANAKGAIARHKAASSALQGAKSELASAQSDQRSPDLSDAEATEAAQRASAASNRVSEAQNAMDGARNDYEAARRDRDTAATRAANAINASNRETNDTTSERINAIVGATLAFIKEVLETFSTIIFWIVVAALIFALGSFIVIGTGGAALALAAGLLTVLTVSGVAEAGVGLTQSLRGERDGVDAAVGVILAIPGIGKVGKMLKDFRAGKTGQNSLQRGLDLMDGKKVDGGFLTPKGLKSESFKYLNRILVEFGDEVRDTLGRPFLESYFRIFTTPVFPTVHQHDFA